MCTGLVERSHIPVVSCGRYLLGVGQEPVDIVGLLVSSDDKPGVLYRVAETIFRHGGNITYVAGGAKRQAGAELQVEVAGEKSLISLNLFDHPFGFGSSPCRP